MRELIYGFFGEDKGQKQFLEQYLIKVGYEHNMFFKQHSYYSKKFQGLNNKGVDNGFRAAWLASFGQKEYRLDCLFIGRDLDSYTSTVREERLSLFESKIADIQRPAWRNHTIFILPMQCIEHWLLALQRQADGRPSKDTRDLESILNDAVKRELYDNHPRIPPEQNKEELVTELAAGMDINWLSSVSNSFLLFDKQVQIFLSGITAL